MGLVDTLMYDEYLSALLWDFRRHNGCMLGIGNVRTHASEVALVASGIFQPRGSSLCWDPDIKKSLLEAYPEQSFEEGIIKLGLSPEVVGSQRMGALKQVIRKKEQRAAKAEAVMQNDVTSADGTAESSGDETDAYIYSLHPYVKEVAGAKKLQMTDAFFNEAAVLRDLPAADILKIYEIDPALLSAANISQIKNELVIWRKTDSFMIPENEQCVKIQINRLNTLVKYTDELFEKIKKTSVGLSPEGKKLLCRQLSAYPTSLNHPYGYSLREILKKAGVSKTTYYKVLNCKGYGMAGEIRRERDARDLALLMHVVEYKGFEKGIRQIYMMMPDITGEQFAISKIRRLLRNAGIKTKVRGENPARQRAKEFHERNTKQNLLKREFRLHRPNEVRLTDVTYLDYGHTDDGGKKRAYGSSCIDPVTGKLLAFNASENNDVELALVTLERLSDHPTMIGALFHSDQGILYLTDEFQAKVEEMGMVQSMSKRGNCWDNAPQESFFGHFKDECHYEDCETFEQLRAMIDEYAYYYNHERHQWSRCRMTPIEYEAYMEAMT
ncbi:MAG: IS3 family transposase, partial [Mogibacterium sp.]|nr:IS3 family transposase [Mogibacterium sp.]